MVELSKLDAFIHIAEKLSFSDAARRLQLTQPTVSHRIKTLEQELDVMLFDRATPTLQLTEAGRLLLPWAHKLIHQALEVEEMIPCCAWRPRSGEMAPEPTAAVSQ